MCGSLLMAASAVSAAGMGIMFVGEGSAPERTAGSDKKRLKKYRIP